MSSNVFWTEGQLVAPATAALPCARFSRRDLQERCLGNVELAERVLRRFRDGLDESLRQLQLLTVASDLAGVSQRAHRLRGEAANVGARLISERASWLEQVAAEGRHAAARAAVEQLMSAGREFRECVYSLDDADE